MLIALGLTVGYTQWWTKPTTFRGIGDEYGFTQTSETLHPVTIDMVPRTVGGDPETITLKEVNSRVVTNTANALISFTVCQRVEGIGTSAQPASACETVSEAKGQPTRLTADASTTITAAPPPERSTWAARR